MTADRRQLVLDLPHRPALGREDFLVAPCNAEAVAWIDLWPGWPGPALVLCGPPASGKTHLAAVWQARAGAVALHPAALPRSVDEHPEGSLHFLLEDAAGLGDEDALLHLYNRIAEAGGTLLLTAAVAPSRWPTRLADLDSRLRAAPVAEIGWPDDELLGALLVKMFADRQLDVTPDVVAFVLPRMERSFAAARALVEKLDAAALAQRRTITVPLARAVLQEEEGRR
jgi:chromosomal replication initiation ATPase DnaA